MTVAQVRQALIEAMPVTRGEELALLLERIDGHVRTTRACWPVVELLSEQSPDARIAVLALDLMRDFDSLADPSARLWRNLVGVVEAHGDASLAERLAKTAIPWIVGNATAVERRDNVARRLALAKPRRAPKPKARATHASAAELLAAIYADPSDLAARAVYADVLSAAGDPRGELVTLQLRRLEDGGLGEAAADREMELLQAHAKAWLGPLGAHVDRGWWKRTAPDIEPSEREAPRDQFKGFVFRGGFVVRVPALKVPPHRAPEVYGDPRWATVLEAERVGGFSPQMRALKVAGATNDALATLPRLGHDLDELRLDAPARSLKLLTAARGVRRVTCDAGVELGWKMLHAIGDGNDVLESFEVNGAQTGRWHSGALATALAPLGNNLVRIGFAWLDGEVVLEREAGKAWTRATVKHTNRLSADDLRVVAAPFAGTAIEVVYARM